MGLGLLALVTFWPVLRHDFINYDDPEYVTENLQVQRGLTWEGVNWAFQTKHAGNWHPLTWLSHMLDVQLYGLRPGWHHLPSLLFHVANALLLLLVLRRMTGALRQSAFVAALFALHPLHVESVAWVAERKDVLSTFFGMLTLWAYTGYVEESKVQSPKSKAWYGMALSFFALGLMSKPILVTLPFVLLLLDHWPLRRFQFHSSSIHHRTFPGLLVEKLPFLALAAMACVVTFYVQQQAGAVGETPLAGRIGNAVISYARYVGKLFWPANLAVFYPRPAEWLPAQIVAAAVTVLCITIGALWLGRRRPYFLVGWLWYLGTLVPVIGIIQVGEQAMADRYTYVPFIGLFVAATWGATELAAGWPQRKPVMVCTTAVVLGACVASTQAQLRHWKTSESLFAHALAVTKDNAVAHNNLGIVCEENGNLTEAIAHFSEAVRINTNYTDAQVNLGIQLARQGKTDEALGHFQAALALEPNAKVHYNLGNLFVEQGDWNEAAKHLSSALEKQPAFAEAHYNLGLVLVMRGDNEAAVAHYREAVRLKTDWPLALNGLAWVLATHPKAEVRNGVEAVRLAERASELTGRQEVNILGTLAAAYAEAGRFPDAIVTAKQVRELALAAGRNDLAEQAEGRLNLYESGKPYRLK